MERPQTTPYEAAANQEDDSTIEEYLGPFYDMSGLMQRYGCSEDELAAMVREGVLVAVPTDEGDQLYPAFQFTEGVVPHPDIVTFVTYLRERGFEALDIAMHLRMVANPYADHASDQDTATTIELIHTGHVQEAIDFWKKYYEVLEGPSGWY